MYSLFNTIILRYLSSKSVIEQKSILLSELLLCLEWSKNIKLRYINYVISTFKVCCILFSVPQWLASMCQSALIGLQKVLMMKESLFPQMGVLFFIIHDCSSLNVFYNQSVIIIKYNSQIVHEGCKIFLPVSNHFRPSMPHLKPFKHAYPQPGTLYTYACPYTTCHDRKS